MSDRELPWWNNWVLCVPCSTQLRTHIFIWHRWQSSFLNISGKREVVHLHWGYKCIFLSYSAQTSSEASEILCEIRLSWATFTDWTETCWKRKKYQRREFLKFFLEEKTVKGFFLASRQGRNVWFWPQFLNQHPENTPAPIFFSSKIRLLQRFVGPERGGKLKLLQEKRLTSFSRSIQASWLVLSGQSGFIMSRQSPNFAPITLNCWFFKKLPKCISIERPFRSFLTHRL